MDGTSLTSRFELLGQVGQGGMGTVYRARDRDLNREVAIKLLLPGRHRGERFAVEAQATARLRHPGVVPVHETGVDDRGRPFLVMDLIEGESLAERLRRGALPPREAADLIEQVAQALAYAHGSGVIHRDVKPENVLLSGGRAVLTDFGLAKVVDQSQELTKTGQLLGTPAYMPPEQIRGQRDRIGPRSDIYAAGATLYSALSGNTPFGAETPVNLLVAVMHQRPQPLPAGVPASLVAICMRCLEKDPDQRYPDAGALADDLGRFLRGDRVEANPGKRRPPMGLLAAAAALTVCAAFAAWLGAAPPTGEEKPESKPAELPVEDASAARELPPELGVARQLLIDGDTYGARSALQGLSAPLPDAQEQLDALLARAQARGEDLCRKDDVPALEPLLALTGRLRELGAVPAAGQLAGAVCTLAGRRELAAERTLGDPTVVQLVTWLADSGLLVTDLEAWRVLQPAYLGMRPRSPDYAKRYYALLLANVRLGVDVTESNFELLRTLSRGKLPPPASPDERYLQWRLRWPRGTPAMEFAVAAVDYMGSEAFAALRPRNRAQVLLRVAASESSLSPRYGVLIERAVALAPDLPRACAKLASWRFNQADQALQRADPEANELLDQTVAEVDAAFACFAASPRDPEHSLLEVGVRCYAIAGRLDDADAIVDRITEGKPGRRRLEQARMQSLSAREALLRPQ